MGKVKEIRLVEEAFFDSVPFEEQLMKVVKEMQDSELAVEIQYQRIEGCASALVIGCE